MDSMRDPQYGSSTTSTMVNENGEMIEEVVNVVEVPFYEDRVTHVKRPETINLERKVSKINYVDEEEIVEVPQLSILQKTVRVPHEEVVTRYVTVPKIVEVPHEVLRYNPVVTVKKIVKVVEVDGEIIPVKKPYLVENEIVVPKYHDVQVPTVVAQQVVPTVTESTTDEVEVTVREYEPYLVSIDVYIPKPVERTLIPGARHEEHHVVDVPASQYNALVRDMNPCVQDRDVNGLYVRHADGSIPVVHGPGSSVVPPTKDDWKDQVSADRIYVSLPSNSGLILPDAPNLQERKASHVSTTSSTRYNSNSYNNYPNNDSQQ